MVKFKSPHQLLVMILKMVFKWLFLIVQSFRETVNFHFVYVLFKMYHHQRMINWFFVMGHLEAWSPIT